MLNRIQSNTTLVGYVDGVLNEEESNHNQESNGLLLHCSESVHGYSGAPILNAKGELVAIQNGVMKMKCFCPGMEYVSVATPIQEILDSLPALLPEVVPYLHSPNAAN